MTKAKFIDKLNTYIGEILDDIEMDDCMRRTNNACCVDVCGRLEVTALIFS